MGDSSESELSKKMARKVASGTPSFSVPGLLFENGTPFSAAQFDMIDQHDAPFHVFVAKIGFTIGACDHDGWASLKTLETPVELNTEDRHYDDDPGASILEESDFAPFKPRCDVIVNAVAYAPKGQTAKTLAARLRVEQAISETKNLPPYINKSLTISGERWYIKKSAMVRLVCWPFKIVTLGLLRPNPWRLSAPQAVDTLPLRYEYAAGGQCRIDSNDEAAKRLPAKQRPGTPAATNERLAPVAVAHEACETNPLGRGYVRNWFLKAGRQKRIAAPLVTVEEIPCTARDFFNGANGKPLPAPAGLGAIGRAWQPRRSFIGQIENKPNWGDDEIPRLPVDFDFSYWNCAPQDQQCDYLNGQERFVLMNLCSPDNPATQQDKRGNTILRFALPRQSVFILAASRSEELTVLPLSLDTVIITPETSRVDLVWRASLSADGTNEASRLMHITEAEQIARLDQLVRHQWSNPDAE
ncbi:MAG: DUF2169 domain-containing protein [Pseudomonadota bacterium]